MIRSTPSLTAFFTAAALTSTASAGGFYLVDRGVRPLGRGGAFVAGADDGHAIWYNPAGLTEAGNGLLLDASLVLFSNTYTRSARPDGAMAPVTFAPSEGSGAPLPIPTLVFTHDFGVRNFRFAAGAYAPYAALPTYDERGERAAAVHAHHARRLGARGGRACGPRGSRTR